MKGFHILVMQKLGKGKKLEEGTLASKPHDFEKPVHPRVGLPIGAVW